ncbi:WD40/YVTN/BNR-like repeat-containing protein [Arsenicicoccus sp. oral taxon 190]|uniref:WD40/YVTN/BNR-like repeat-containing protein n=1 Tax=Arsenicicoccus sp. oral taxon 190 TaxID=1658671 RepID=UPI00067A17C5|nr:hypothetical protein [Arsenicicoccus sp. oral taxon 190]AKT52020.1 hypothetical protein ADJ73_13365 [Arsenicicoccus sp. oral taxon 190]
MSDHDDFEPRQRPDDPVADFFRAERASVTPQTADELRWRRIAREGRAGRRAPRRWHGVAAGAAAAAVAAGVILARQGLGLGAEAPAVPAGPSVVATRAAAVGAPVPADFDLASVSEAQAEPATVRTLHALGSATCGPQGSCPVLASSRDAGRTWRVTAVFPDNTVLDPDDALARPTSRTLSRVVFADDIHGWAFGGALLRTDDGGRTWERAGRAGEVTLAVEPFAGEVAMASVRECGADTCGGTVSVSQGPADAAARTSAVPTTRGDAPVQRVALGWDDAGILVSGTVRTDGGPVAMQAARVQANGGVTPISALRSGCPGSFGLLVARPEGAKLFASCFSGVRDTADLAVMSSGDRGDTWDFASVDPAQGLPATSLLAAADDQHLVAASPTSYLLVASADGGATFAKPRQAPATTTGWSELRHGSGGFVAVPRGRSGLYYLGSHDGMRWTKVQVAQSS